MALERAGLNGVDAESAVRRAGGWVAGVLFAGRDESAASPDLLHRYLGAQVVGSLPAHERDFLIRTSLLAEVNASEAQALGIEEPGKDRKSTRLNSSH